MRRVLAAAGLVTACALGGALGGYAGTHETAKPLAPQVTSDTPWLDGCSTDADCAAMEQAMRQLYPDTIGESEDVTSEGDGPWEQAWLNVDCEFDSPDVALETPCIVPADPIPFTEPDGTVHPECVVVLTTAEDSELVCSDDTVWPS